MKVAEFAILAILLLAEFVMRQLMVELDIAAKLFAPSGASGLLNLLLAMLYLALRLLLILGLPTWVVWRWLATEKAGRRPIGGGSSR